MFNKVILKVGAPCSGKGALGKALRVLHGDLIEILVMRDVIEEERAINRAFDELSRECEGKGGLVPLDHIKRIVLGPVLRAKATKKPYLMFDGLPRDENQPSVVDDQFCGSAILLVESVANEEYLEKVFLQTLNSASRGNRLDAKLNTHHGRVELYNRNLPGIIRAAQARKWTHHRLDVERINLATKVRHFEKWLNLSPVPAERLENIEDELGLPKLNLAA